MRSAPGSRDLKQAWWGVTRTKRRAERHEKHSMHGRRMRHRWLGLPPGASGVCGTLWARCRPAVQGPFAAGQQLAVPPVSARCPSAIVGPRTHSEKGLPKEVHLFVWFRSVDSFMLWKALPLRKFCPLIDQILTAFCLEENGIGLFLKGTCCWDLKS